MRMKRLLAAALACCTALSSVPFLSAFADGGEEAASPDLVFDFQTTDGSNEVTVSTQSLAAGDQSVPVKLFVPSNPGVNGISLKMQINDGEVDENDIFHNYGITMTKADLASPYCFDSENEGDPTKCFEQTFNESQMNLFWSYRMAQDVNADSSSEEGKTAWDETVSWAYDKPFAEMSLNIPKETPVGDYVLDIRREPYINAATLEAGKKWPAKSDCTSADGESVDFKSKPLTIHVLDYEKLECEITATVTLTMPEGVSALTVGEPLSLAGGTAAISINAAFSDGTTDSAEIEAALPETCELNKVRIADCMLQHHSGYLMIPLEIHLDTSAVDPNTPGTYPVTVTVDGVGAAEPYGTASADVNYIADAGTTAEPAETTTAAAPEETTTTEVTTTAEVTTTTETTASETTAVLTETTSSAAPVESTEAPVESTEAPAESTEAPAESTEAPAETSLPEETTTVVSVSAEPVENSYAGMAEGMYMVLGDASGAPGEKVKVPVYVFNDPGTAGMSLYWVYTEGLGVRSIGAGEAYLCSAQPSSKTIPISFVFTCPEGKNQQAADGSAICYITFTIPEDAPDGKVYQIEWIEEGGKTVPGVDKYTEAVNTDRVNNRAKLFPGTITVNASKTPRLNYERYSFAKAGEQLKLAVLDAYGTGIKWSSSDDTVAEVAENGVVTAKADSGDCTVTAEVLNGSGESLVLTCAIHVGLFGDVDGDGEVSAYDSMLVLRGFNDIILELDPEDYSLTPEQIVIGDVDLDGELTAYDAAMILKYSNLMLAEMDPIWYDLIGKPGVPGAP
ncbi:MAG: hypothetical protein J6Z45_05930 [Oscillospiraceae bacterium]|nr:hypothetical protein [Oscillospiraceae bacterium]